MWIQITYTLAVALVICAAYVDLLWRRCRRLKVELAEMTSLVVLLDGTAYSMSCQLHGKEATDLAIKRAHSRRAN